MVGNKLFCKAPWFDVEANQRQRMTAEIAQYDSDELLNTPVDALSKYFPEKYAIDVPILDREGIIADQREVQIDVRRDDSFDMMYRDHGITSVTGIQIELQVPFSGDPEAFLIRPTSFSHNLPYGDVRPVQ